MKMQSMAMKILQLPIRRQKEVKKAYKAKIVANTKERSKQRRMN